MPRLCEICGFNFDKYGTPGSDLHRCSNGRVAGTRRPTKLESELIAQGKLDPAKLVSQPASKPLEPVGRLAPKLPPMAPTRQPQVTCACRASCDEVLQAIKELRQLIEALKL